MADGRFGCEADMAGRAAGSTRSLVTPSRHGQVDMERVEARQGAGRPLLWVLTPIGNDTPAQRVE
jgi:hypothetical protein